MNPGVSVPPFLRILFGTSLIAILSLANVGADPPEIVPVTEPGRIPHAVFAPAYYVQISGSYAYVASRDGGMAIFNIQDPSNPYYVGQVETQAPEEGYQFIRIVGNRLYATVVDYRPPYRSLLRVFDLSNPTNPIQKSEIQYNQFPLGRPFIVGSRAYVPLEDMFAILDLQDPSNIKQIGGVLVGNHVSDIWVEGRYAYVLTVSQVRIYDISDPAKVILVGTTPPGNVSTLIRMEGNYAYVVERDVGIQVFDRSNPTNLVWLNTTFPMRTLPWRNLTNIVEFKFTDTLAYIACNSAGFSPSPADLFAIDWKSNPTNLAVVTRFHPAADIYGIDVGGGHIWTAEGDSGLEVLRSDGISLTPVGQYNKLNWHKGGVTAVRGGYAFILGDADGLDVVDISNPTVPVRVAFLGLGIWGTCIEVSGSRAYVGTVLGLEIIDISQPTQPRHLGGYRGLGKAVTAIKIRGAYAFLTYVGVGGGGLAALEVSDPSRITTTGRRAGGTMFGLEFGGDSYLYALDYDADVKIVDVTNPANLDSSTVGVYLSPSNNVRSLAVEGTRLYVLARRELYVADISNPREPRTIGIWPLDRAVEGEYLTVHQDFAIMTSGLTTGQPQYFIDAINCLDPDHLTRVAHFRIEQLFSLRAGDYGLAMLNQSFLLVLIPSLDGVFQTFEVRKTAGQPVTVETRTRLNPEEPWTEQFTVATPSDRVRWTDYIHGRQKFYRARQPGP